MTEEESDVFEITDFTTASEWERFIARIEEVLHEWKLANCAPSAPLTKGELANGTWCEKSESLQFADFSFTITYHYLQNHNSSANEVAVEEQEGKTPTVWLDLLSVESDFPSRVHCLVRWYGLREFLVISPASNSDSISTESKANVLLSSVSIAINNTCCPVAVFAQVHQKWRRLYMGQSEAAGFRTSFEMLHLKKIPHNCNYLSGLVDVFKAKLACPVTSVPPVSVSVRFTYVLQDWPQYSWPQLPPDMDSAFASEIGCSDFGELPFGACEDPVSELHLSATWPSLSEEMIVDNDVYSDLDPLQAPHWSVRIRMTDEPQCLLSDYVNEFVKLAHRKESTDQLLGSLMLEEDSFNEPDVSQALQRLTEPVPYHMPSISNVVSRASNRLQLRPEEAPIPADMLNEILLFLFPDAKSDTNEDEDDAPDPEIAEKMGEMKERFRQLKSAPAESLTHKLAVCMCIVNHSHGGLRAVAHLWQEFVLEMRYRLENNYIIPGLDKGSPNMGCSLLHQKLQMLNCCIERKRARESMSPHTSTSNIHDEDSEEEPMEDQCDDGVVAPSAGDNKQTSSGSTDSSDEKKSDAEKCSNDGNETSDDEFYECLESESQTSLSQAAAAREEQTEIKGKDLSDKEIKDCEKEAKDTNETEKETKKGDDNTEQCSDNADGLVTSKTSTDSELAAGEEKMDTDQNEPSDSVETVDSAFKDTFTHQPEGRLRPCGDLHLLNTDRVLYIPVTQEPSPMTEDMLEEHAEVLAKLGTSPEGAHLRARMQSACLLSDMEAFKAANPGATLGDFVRWYSPRDWVEDEEADEEGGTTGKKGQLSQRMQIPGNMWVDVWQNAKPVPARRQRRLFDDTKEAEKVLHWLASMKPSHIVLHVTPMLVHAALIKIAFQEGSEKINTVKTLINQVTGKCAKVTRMARLDIHKYEEVGGKVPIQCESASLNKYKKDVARQLGLAELVITRAQSLQKKFQISDNSSENTDIAAFDVDGFVSSLLEQPEVTVTGAARGPPGAMIHRLFSASQKSSFMMSHDGERENQRRPSMVSDFPIPAGKEYLLRTTVPRPAPWSRPSPQRMFCVVVSDDFRLAGAFSTDTTFQ